MDITCFMGIYRHSEGIFICLCVKRVMQGYLAYSFFSSHRDVYLYVAANAAYSFLCMVM